MSSGVTKTINKFENVIKASSIEDTMDDAKQIIRVQVGRLKLKSNTGMSLDNDELKNLRILVQSLMDLSREEREIDKQDNLNELLSGLSKEELLQLYQKQLDSKK